MGDEMLNQSHDGDTYQPTMMHSSPSAPGQMQGRAQDTEKQPAGLRTYASEIFFSGVALYKYIKNTTGKQLCENDVAA